MGSQTELSYTREYDESGLRVPATDHFVPITSEDPAFEANRVARLPTYSSYGG